MAAMNSPPRLRLELRPSRIAGAAIVIGTVATAALMLVLPLDPWWTAATLLAIGGVAARALGSCIGRGAPRLLIVSGDRRLAVIARDGRSCDGSILDDSYVGASITTIVWRPDPAPWYTPARAIVVLRDSLAADDFRRLRVLLRYGQPAVDNVASGRDAG
jgi:hypothetical protein